MNKTIKELKEEIVKILTKAGVPGVGYVVDWNKVADMIIGLFESAIARAKSEEREAIRLRAQAIGTPDGYVNIDNLFGKTKKISLKKFLSTLSKKDKK